MPTLFFDIDGCLHPHGLPRFIEGTSRIYRGDDDGLFVWSAPLIQALETFQDLTLVCHSHWRTLYDLEGLRRELPSALAARTIALVPPLRERHAAIQTYVVDHALHADEYWIMDDDPWAFPIGTPNLLIVDSTLGLSSPTSQAGLVQALERLNFACRLRA